MASIPSPIRKWVRRYITGEGSEEVASQSPVQSVNSQTGDVTISVPVDQVNGQTGDVTLTASDVNALADTYTAPVQSVNGDTGDVTINVPVDSVNGKTGTVTLSASDVNALAETYSAPVQSVNSQTGDVTISTGGGVIPSSQTVASYSDLPLTDRSQAEIWFVTGENDIVASTQLSPVVWRSLPDFTTVVSKIPDSVVSRTADSETSGYTEGRGVQITSTETWPEIGAEISSNPSGFSRAIIYDASTADVMGQKDISVLTNGDTFTIDLESSLQPDTLYNFVMDDNGGSYTGGFDDSPTFPYTSDDGDLEITAGALDATGSTTAAIYSYIRVGNVGF